MDDYQNEAMPVGAAEVAAATQTLQRYKAGKAALDRRLVDNELWFRMGHWKNYQNPMMPGKAQPSSGWLFNSIANKHADAMDNYPEPNVLPRAADDEATARALSSVLPVVLEQADYEQVYSDCWWRKLKQGTGVTGVFWDPAARGGVGDIAVRAMNLLMLYWEPGVADIQDSPDFFSLSLEDTAQLTARYPQLAGHTAGVLDVPRYIHEDGADTASRSVVVDWYYKRPDESGRMVLHYCKFCNGVVLYASQNDPALAQRGLYDHGQYPFVFDPLFMEEDSPAGFGYIDVMKDCQTAIDQMNHAMDENVLLSARQRYVLSDTAGVNEEELADLSRDIVHVVGRLNDDSFRPLQTAGLQGSSLSYRQSRIEELKEISGNRDMTQGGTTGGVTAASAIAALQEAGSKLSRDMLKSAYRAFSRQCYLMIELMRQFYDEQRIFRIVGPSGENQFLPFSAAALRPQPVREVGGVEADMAIRGALTTPGTNKPLAILDMGAGSTDASIINAEGQIHSIHLAGAGNMVTLLIQSEMGLPDFDTAEDVKKYPLAKVESLFHIRHENGTVEFFQQPLDPNLFAKVVILKEGKLLPLEGDWSMEKIRLIRQQAKQKVFVTNAIRALTRVSPTGNVRDIQFVVLVGGSALDFEVPQMVTDALSQYKVVAGRGNIRGTEGPRNAVATGLVLSLTEGRG
jgi:hypothetical protein